MTCSEITQYIEEILHKQRILDGFLALEKPDVKSAVATKKEILDIFESNFALLFDYERMPRMDYRIKLAKKFGGFFATDFHFGVAEIRLKGPETILVNKMGRQIGEKPYDSVSGISENGLIGVSESKYGNSSYFINGNGQKNSDKIYYWVGGFSEGLAPVEKIRRLGTKIEKYFVDKDEKNVFGNKTFSGIGVFSEGKALIHEPAGTGQDKYYFIDKTGEQVSADYDSADSFSGGFAKVWKEDIEGDNKWFFINHQGENQFKEMFYKMESFSEGFAAVERIENGRFLHYFIGKNGKNVFDRTFDNANSFSCGLAAVYEGTRWHYIDKTGNRAFPGDFRDAQLFEDGLAYVWDDNDERYYIDTKGNRLDFEEMTSAGKSS